MVDAWDARRPLSAAMEARAAPLRWHAFKRRPLMLEAYDRDKTAALLQEARDVTVALNCEIREIATQVRHILDGGEKGADGIEGHASDVADERRPDVAMPTAEARKSPAAKSFWQFWR
jgi:hypothetical protein